MIYLYVGENPTDRTEVNTISYVVPENIELYKAIEEKDLPKEKEGYYKKIFYNKTKDVVMTEYTPIPPTQEELLKEELVKTKLELSTAITELADMVMAGSTGNV